VPDWSDILAAVGVALGPDKTRGRELLTQCWDDTVEHDHAQRCVLAHYLADLQDDLDAEVAWDERALAAYRRVGEADLAPIGIASADGLAPSLHLNLGDGYLRQGRLEDAETHLDAGLDAVDSLPDDRYAAMVRNGLDGLHRRLVAARQS
jgi:hypothetical protein